MNVNTKISSEGLMKKWLLEAWMNRLLVGDVAPDFALPNHKGELFKLSDVYQNQNVLLVFNLGFI